MGAGTANQTLRRARTETPEEDLPQPRKTPQVYEMELRVTAGPGASVHQVSSSERPQKASLEAADPLAD